VGSHPKKLRFTETTEEEAMANILDSIPIWQAVIDPSGSISCQVVSLESAAAVAKRMTDAGQRVIALTDGEITIEGDDLRALLADPDAIHMHNGKLYDSRITYKLGAGLQA
jgi:hypothetical protein